MIVERDRAAAIARAIGAARRRRHRADRRQGPRAVPGDRRRAPSVRRSRGRAARWRSAAERAHEAAALSRIAQWTGGRLPRRRDRRRRSTRVATDTRTLDAARRRLFVALKGERFDGARLSSRRAPTRGARAALVDARGRRRACRRSSSPTPSARSATSRAALQRTRSAQAWSAITGSNGKTTRQDAAASILRAARPARYVNAGNLNNEIGLPLAVLDAARGRRVRRSTRWAPASPATSPISAIARPDVGLVNNVAPAHLERMGSLRRRRRNQGRDLRRAAGRRRRGHQCRRRVRAVLRRARARRAA